MQIGINGTGLVQGASIEAITQHAQTANADGFASYWLAEHPTGGLDALMVLTVVGLSVPRIELGTAIVPTFPRHPMAMAGQMHTALNAIGPRLTLGIGLSHAPMLAQLGIPFDKPIRHLREYLSILVPLLNQGRVDFKGEMLSCEAVTFFKPEAVTPVVVAALGPQALKVAGTLADGTTLAWVGPKTVREHIKPRLSEAAAAAGKAAPRIIATLPVCVTNDEAGIRARIGRNLAMYGELPSYKAMFEREGIEGPGQLAIVGNEDQVRAAIEEMREAGVTDFAASEFTTNDDERQRTRALLKQLLV
ncbi:TIGR03564 family F420-dependent LLM class oxidoreductase [Pseudomonadales bacterium]|nr:TIGR03564 family F420-dependent LLM class oxidoreductase [Pseudomonadales bacterium]MDB9880250.1 TIGR03564 family F420-dependent LLM class oxidoreductase [Pseudomonadales bacterium]MDB9942363.1 TIGR03564 family F420-dependent LLM class oxidoreductase [Pseudomonadales bacterium]MDC0174410.1 TIGR03564 family F420-dependent LLM class oxidoreductase [Pseudomonadales bacterium]MDC1306783.1 TIGR03564 family F420-dependent LLM class oxidoreductase [Pseudomonadales bacterium]